MNREDRGSRNIACAFRAHFLHTMRSSASAWLPDGEQFYPGHLNSEQRITESVADSWQCGEKGDIAASNLSPHFLFQVMVRETTGDSEWRRFPPVPCPISSGVEKYTRSTA